jgi:hypothetical protein
MPLKIRVVNLSEAEDLGSWSGTIHHFAQVIRPDQS